MITSNGQEIIFKYRAVQSWTYTVKYLLEGTERPVPGSTVETGTTLSLIHICPIAAAAPAFTADMKGDINLASAVNSLSIIISMVCITCVLIAVL